MFEMVHGDPNILKLNEARISNTSRAVPPQSPLSSIAKVPDIHWFRLVGEDIVPRLRDLSAFLHLSNMIPHLPLMMC